LVLNNGFPSISERSSGSKFSKYDTNLFTVSLAACKSLKLGLESYKALNFLQASLNIGSLNSSSVILESFFAASYLSAGK